VTANCFPVGDVGLSKGIRIEKVPDLLCLQLDMLYNDLYRLLQELGYLKPAIPVELEAKAQTAIVYGNGIPPTSLMRT
jgi:hypothetical protein